jgi:hypothetical protein
MNQDFLNEITSACKEDTRLRDILRRILSRDKYEIEDFKKKMNIYFIGRDSEEDLKSKRFFQFVLEASNAELVAKSIGII